MNTLFLFLLVSGSVISVNGSNILGIFASHSVSHNIIHMAVVDALIQKGHNVTVITVLPLKEKNPKYHHVYIPPPPEVQNQMNESVERMSKASGLGNLLNMLTMVKAMINIQYDLMLTEQFQNVIHGDTKFDLLLLGYAMNDFQLAIASQLKVPVVISWVNAPMSPVNFLLGNPNSISFVPYPFLLSDQPMGFMDRLKSFIFNSGFMYGVEKFMYHKFSQYYE